MKYPILFVLLTTLIPLSGCIKDPEPDLKRMVTCAFSKDADAKASACSVMTNTENRILDCAINRKKQVNRQVACKDLTPEERKFIPMLDASRPVGTQFTLPALKLGK